MPLPHVCLALLVLLAALVAALLFSTWSMVAGSCRCWLLLLVPAGSRPAIGDNFHVSRRSTASA
jgi:hypothetical protein